MKIEDIDSNFKIAEILRDDLIFRNAGEAPFRIFGLLDDSPLMRMPKAVAEATGERIAVLNQKTAGGRIRFKTDSDEIAIFVNAPKLFHVSKTTRLSDGGFDVYSFENEAYKYIGSLIPPGGNCEYFEASVKLPDRNLRDITINFPTFGEFESLLVGLKKDAVLLEGENYRNENPIIYYGSSITQGQCASRPGYTYEAIISRHFNCDYRNLGFSGNARGDITLAEYISSQPMCLFVMDYDHNSPTTETLKQTHERFFLEIRKNNPKVPVIIISKTDTPFSQTERENISKRREIIYKTYENALKRGDKNVYFINGNDAFKIAKSMGISPDDCTIDGCHPNDMGYACMAKLFGDKIGEILGWL